MMRPPKLERGEIEIEPWLQFLAIPRITAEELLVIVALFVPSRQKRAREVEPLPVPALRHHIHLPANLLLVKLFRLLWIGNIEHAALAVTEAIYKQRLVVGAQANVNRKHTALNVTDRRNILRLPFAAIVRVDQP